LLYALLKLRLESIAIGIYAFTPLARFALPKTNSTHQKRSHQKQHFKIKEHVLAVFRRQYSKQTLQRHKKSKKEYYNYASY
jgi:hypothetical protein